MDYQTIDFNKDVVTMYSQLRERMADDCMVRPPFSSLTSSYQPFQQSGKGTDPGQPWVTQDRPNPHPASCKHTIRRWTDPGRSRRVRVEGPLLCALNASMASKLLTFYFNQWIIILWQPNQAWNFRKWSQEFRSKLTLSLKPKRLGVRH